MKSITHLKHAAAATALLGGLTSLGFAGIAQAVSTTASNTSTTNDQAHLQNIKSKGDQEITRRLSSLSTLDSKINAATRLSASDKTTLLNEVNSEVSGLSALKTKLDAETTLTGAKADAQSIYTDYRVYALVTPKVYLVKTADDQQVVEGKLTTLAGKLQTRLTSAQSQGKDVSSLESQLRDLNAKVAASQAISSSIESKVIGLQPSDYNSDHTILSGDRDQLQTAHSDNQAAYQDAKNIVAGLKNL